MPEILDLDRPVSAVTLEQLWRPSGGIKTFSDTVSEVVPTGDPYPWRFSDFDEVLTRQARQGDYNQDKDFPNGLYSWTTPYAAELIDDLEYGRIRSVGDDNKASISERAAFHPDRQKRLTDIGHATIVLINRAFRSKRNIENHKNGQDFFLAITDSGVEYYVTPLSYLSDLDEANRITALYRIPTDEHPVFEKGEQFRSSWIKNTREHASHLRTVFQYSSREELISAKEEGRHPTRSDGSPIIPLDKRAGWTGFIDKYGNVRLRLRDITALGDIALGDRGTLLVKASTHLETHKIPVVHATSLTEGTPSNELVVYHNVSDYTDSKATGGIVELVSRVDKDPSSSKDTAIFLLRNLIRGLNPASAEFKLVA